MSWYAAHIVMMVKLKEQPQERYPIWENIVLLDAASDDEAFDRAEQRGRDEEGDEGGSFRWGGKPAEWVFAGVRKVTSCDNSEERPGDGTEVSFLEMELSSPDAVEKYVEGEPSGVTVRDTFASGSEV